MFRWGNTIESGYGAQDDGANVVFLDFRARDEVIFGVRTIFLGVYSIWYLIFDQPHELQTYATCYNCPGLWGARQFAKFQSRSR